MYELEVVKESIIKDRIENASKWSLRTIGYSLIGSTLASYANILSFQVFLFGNDGIQTYESMATLGVGAIFVFSGEYLNLYKKALIAKGRYSRGIIRELSDIESNLRVQNKKYDHIIEILGRHADDEDFNTHENT